MKRPPYIVILMSALAAIGFLWFGRDSWCLVGIGICFLLLTVIMWLFPSVAIIVSTFLDCGDDEDDEGPFV